MNPSISPSVSGQRSLVNSVSSCAVCFAWIAAILSGPASAQAVDLTRGDCPVTVVGRSQGAWLTTNPPATQGLELITVAGGNLYKSEVSSTQASSIGSNGNDNNTWGTGSTASVKRASPFIAICQRTLQVTEVLAVVIHFQVVDSVVVEE